MFNDDFYPVFDKKYKNGFVMYCEGSLIYGKDLTKILKKKYNIDSMEMYSKMFINDVNSAFRDYARVCHIALVYDSFTEKMKNYLSSSDTKYTLCEIQNMTRREIFTLFDGASIDLLYEVASNLFSYCKGNDDSHDEIF